MIHSSIHSTLSFGMVYASPLFQVTRVCLMDVFYGIDVSVSS